jgi:hypothetical protein
MSARLSRIRVMTQYSQRVSRCLNASPGEAVNEAVKRKPFYPEVASDEPGHEGIR